MDILESEAVANKAQSDLVDILFLVATGNLNNQHVFRNDMSKRSWEKLQLVLELIEKGRHSGIQERQVGTDRRGKILGSYR